MILHCNYEELRAIREGARIILEEGGGEQSPVAAPPTERTRVQHLVPRLDGDLTVETLEEQRTVAAALETIVAALEADMEGAIAHRHPGHESAVKAYFEYAHAFAVLARVREMGEEMEAMIELVTGEEPTDESAESFLFPD